MTLDTVDLEAFLVVVRHGSFGRAASSLLVSQPTVSERIARLERSVGADLFIRGSRGVTVTRAGERLLPLADRITDLMDEAVETVRFTDRPLPLRVGVHSTFAYRVVPLVLGALGDPTRGLRVRDAHSDEIVAMLLDGVLDAGFILPGARPPSLRFVSLAPDPVVCVCAPSHELARLKSVPIQSLVEHDIAVNLWGTGANEVSSQLAAPDASGHRVECSDTTTALRLALDNDYLAFVAQSATNGAVASGTLKVLKIKGLPSWSVRLVLASKAKGKVDSDILSLQGIVRHPRSKVR